MRKNRENQLPLSPSWPDHRLARELESISKILDQNPSISDLVLHDLCDKVSSKNGARGMTAEQVLRCALIKQTHQFSYEKLAFHLIDSQSFRTFCRLPYGFTPSKSTLQENISRIEASTWQAVNRVLLNWADKKGLEKGRKIRVDATGVQSNIRYPLDSHLLYDSIRVVTRLLKRLNPSESYLFCGSLPTCQKTLFEHPKQSGREAQKALSGSLEDRSKDPGLRHSGTGAGHAVAGPHQPGPGRSVGPPSGSDGASDPTNPASGDPGPEGPGHRKDCLHL